MIWVVKISLSSAVGVFCSATYCSSAALSPTSGNRKCRSVGRSTGHGRHGDRITETWMMNLAVISVPKNLPL